MASRNQSGKPRRTTSGRKQSKPPSKPPSLPDITVEERPVGRATLNAIWDEMSPLSRPRSPLVTVGYEEKPLDKHPQAPVAIHPATPPADPGPEISVCETRPGMETLAIIEDELLRESPRRSETPPADRYAHAEVLEVCTFIVLDNSLSPAASEEEKRAFVARRLWHRLPPGGIAAVRRIDVRLADSSALLMRVWCVVPKIDI